MKKNFLRAVARTIAVIGMTVATLVSAPLVHAQLRIETAGVGASQIPIAIAGFSNESLAPQQITAIIKADLSRSGMFKIIDTGDVLSEASQINYGDWKSRGAD